MATDLCSVDGCTRPVRARGWCGTHYYRWRSNGDPLAVQRRRKRATYVPTVCAVEGCSDLVQYREWCSVHYGRWRRRGDADLPPLGKGHKAGRCVVCDGPDTMVVNRLILAGQAYAAVADEAGFTCTTIQRHAVRCLGFIKTKGPHACLICTHPDVLDIENEAISSNVSATAKRRGVSRNALYNHMSPKHQEWRAAYAASRLAATVRAVTAP